MIDALLPAGVAWAERFDDAEPGELFPEEAATVARAVDRRRREFTTGRWCARQALAQLGIGPTAILPGECGAPGWPPGVVGAITHCDGYRAAVAARAEKVSAIGVDAAPAGPLPDGVLDVVSLPVERDDLVRLFRQDPATCWDTLLFSAKESLYKAWFPTTRRFLGSEESRIRFDLGAGDQGTFFAEVLAASAPGWTTHYSGRWLIGRGLVVTVVVVPAPGRLG